MNRVILDCQTKTDAARIIKMQHIDRDIGDLHTVDVSAFFIDDEQLEQSVLVAV